MHAAPSAFPATQSSAPPPALPKRTIRPPGATLRSDDLPSRFPGLLDAILDADDGHPDNVPAE